MAVTIVGSVHMDLIATADRLPGHGESVRGHSFAMQPGGKGGNQAAAVALQGVTAYLVGRVGQDLFGEHLRAALKAKGVDTTYLTTDPAIATGASPILAAAGGDYSSIIVPGAGLQLGEVEIDAAVPAFASSRVLLTQLELDPATIAAAVAQGRAHGLLVMLNASPAPAHFSALPSSRWAGVDLLIVNQVEAALLTDRTAATPRPGDDLPRHERGWRDRDELASLGRELIARVGTPTVIITLGEAGAMVVERGSVRLHPTWPVPVVDTIGAGDAFAGALAAALAGGADLDAAITPALAAGALAVTRAGAFEAQPTRAEVDGFLAERGVTIGG